MGSSILRSSKRKTYSLAISRNFIFHHARRLCDRPPGFCKRCAYCGGALERCVGTRVVTPRGKPLIASIQSCDSQVISTWTRCYGGRHCRKSERHHLRATWC